MNIYPGVIVENKKVKRGFGSGSNRKGNSRSEGEIGNEALIKEGNKYGRREGT